MQLTFQARARRIRRMLRWASGTPFLPCSAPSQTASIWRPMGAAEAAMSTAASHAALEHSSALFGPKYPVGPRSQGIKRVNLASFSLQVTYWYLQAADVACM